MLKADPDLVISGSHYPYDICRNNRLPVTRSTIQARFFSRFLRTNAPAALRQVWSDVRLWNGLSAIGSHAVLRTGNGTPPDPCGDNCWLDFDSNLPAETSAVLTRFMGDFAASYFRLDGGCRRSGCDLDILSGTTLQLSRDDPPLGHCPCAAHLFADDADCVINDVLVIPRIIAGEREILQALVFLSGQPIEPPDARFLHSAAGLHFAQQAIWDSGCRREPAVALRPREIECVRWAVAGKTLSEIAAITGLSYRTVRFHLDAARSRYGFSTNQQLFVQAAKDYGLDPDADATPATEEDRLVKSRNSGRLQPQWTERRNPRDRRAVTERRRMVLANLPFPDRRKGGDRRTGLERRTVAPAEESRSTGDGILTPEEIRALLN